MMRAKRPWLRSLMLLHLEICQHPRPWECGNPKGISKECGKGGKPASWLSMLSILCHFHDLLFARHCWIFQRVFNERIIVKALIETPHGSKNQPLASHCQMSIIGHTISPAEQDH